MSILEITILITALISFLFSVAIFFHGRKNLVENLFAFLALNFSVWSLSTFFVTAKNIPFTVFKFGAYTHYISGNLIFLSFLIFSVYYMFKLKISRFWLSLVVAINAIIIALVVFRSLLFASLRLGATVADKIQIDPNGYFVFSMIMILMFVIAQFYLFRKYKSATALDKTHLGFLIFGTSISGSCGLIFNLIFPGFSNFDFFYAGPVVAMPLFVGILVYAIVKYKLFNLRVIASEIFTALLVIAMSVSLFTAVNRTEMITRSVVLTLSIFFGYFLIRSVYGEVRQREEIERLAGDLEKANVELKKLDAAKSEFISLAGHQLRAPLTAIKGYASMVLEGSFGKIEESVHEALRRVIISADHLVKLAADLLDLSRIEAGKFRYTLVPLDFSEIIKKGLEELEEVSKEKDLAIEFMDENKEKLKINSDADKMHEIVINLVDNALKYTKDGPIIVKLEVTNSSGHKNLRFSVRDKGIGVPKDELPKLFTKFARTEVAKKVRPEGMGLGLYFVKKIVEDHGGRTWAESDGLNKGSTFIVELPAI